MRAYEKIHHPCFFRVLGPRHFSCIRISYAPKNQWSTFGSWDTQKVDRDRQGCIFSKMQLLKAVRHWVVLAFWLWNVHRAATACTFSASQLQLPKVSGPGVLCTFWLGNVLSATAAGTFWTAQLPKVLRGWNVFSILTSRSASRHSGVQFLISHLASWLRTLRFSELTFRPSGGTKHWENTVFRDFSTFSRACIFFLLALSLLWACFFCLSLLWLFPPLLFHLSILSEVWLLNFLRQGGKKQHWHTLAYSLTRGLSQLGQGQPGNLKSHIPSASASQS